MKSRSGKFTQVLIFFGTFFLILSPASGQTTDGSASWHYCQVQTPGMRPLKYRGSSLNQAMMRTAQACVDQQRSAYESQRGTLPLERAELFVEKCVNLVQCSQG